MFSDRLIIKIQLNSSMSFAGKTVWIVGASSGIGKALTIDMAKQKANIVLSSRNIEELENVKQTCLQYTDKCHIIVLDFEQNSNYNIQVQEVVSFFERIDYLILVGGISQRSYAFETPHEIDRKLMEVNYFGNVFLTKAVLPIMINQKFGHIVVVSSIAGKFGWQLRSAYSASKHALHGFYDSLRAEQYANNIRVTIAVPGRVKTKISENALLKDGGSYGKLDEGQENGISAHACSQEIIKAIKKNKKEVLIGGKEINMVWIRKFLPFLYYKFAAKTEPNK